MELVERYLQAVRFWLPKKQQDDIIAELSEDLRAQMEEREVELGRTLNEPEIEDLLRRRGSPIRVASGYLPQRSLIGPELFPVYVFALKILTVINIVLVAGGYIAGTFALATAHVVRIHGFHFFVGTMRVLWAGWLLSVAILTLVFAVFERTPIKEQIFARWNPRKLPPLQPANAIPRSNSIGNLLGLACLCVFWVLKMAPPLTIHLGNFQIETPPAWSFVFWAVLVLTLGSSALEVSNLLRPWWTTGRAMARLVLDFGGFSVFCWSMQAHFVASVSWPGATLDQTAFVTTHLNLWLARIFPWAAAVKFIVVAFDVWRVHKTLRKTEHTGWNPVRNPL